jgi:hypothetical protein
MRRILTIGLLTALSAAVGYYIPWLPQFQKQAKFSVEFPDRDSRYVKAPAPNQDYACSAIADAAAYEDKIGGPTANARSGAGTDNVALKISDDGKGVLLLTAAAVKLGVTEAGPPIPITLRTKDYLVASRVNGLDVDTLIIDLKTLNAVWSYTGQGMLGVKGQSFLLSCH